MNHTLLNIQSHGWLALPISLFLGVFIYFYVQFKIINLRLRKKLLIKKVAQRTAEINRQKEEIILHRDEIEAQRDQLEEKSNYLQSALSELSNKNDQLTSSLNYASRIQHTMFPSQEKLFKVFPTSFLLFKPRDIVSGDFYWFTQVGNRSIVVVADCTGHGVPAALMSMIGFTLLNQIVKEEHIECPAEILNRMHFRVSKVLKLDHDHKRRSDGMDVGIACIDTDTCTIHFAGARRPLYLARPKNNFVEIKGDKFPVGGMNDFRPTENHQFTRHEVAYEKGDILYLTTDGYADQFGTSEDRKFMVRRLKNLIQDLAREDMETQKEVINSAHDLWKGKRQQTDDILLIGLKL